MRETFALRQEEHHINLDVGLGKSVLRKHAEGLCDLGTPCRMASHLLEGDIRDLVRKERRRGQTVGRELLRIAASAMI
jgi:hypothetical protein